MDIFRFTESEDGQPTGLVKGEIINGLKSKMWVERYRNAGTFEFKATPESFDLTKLPVGSYISHVDSSDIMIVENHEVIQERGKETEIKISGRSLETILEHRVVGGNREFPNVDASVQLEYASQKAHVQALFLIEQHIDDDIFFPDNAFPLDDVNLINFLVTSDASSPDGTAAVRTVRKGNLYEQVMALLEIDDIGIKIERPYAWTYPLDPYRVRLTIHSGDDVSSDVVFSYETGELERAEYLWSNQTKKTAAVVSGKWVEVFTEISHSPTNYFRRTMSIDASDIDGDFTEVPTGTDLTAIEAAMVQRGQDILRSQKNEVALVNVEVAKDLYQTNYRNQYSVGDIVMVHGSYDDAKKMRITEFVEIEDETGQIGFPTLANINED